MKTIKLDDRKHKLLLQLMEHAYHSHMVFQFKYVDKVHLRELMEEIK